MAAPPFVQVTFEPVCLAVTAEGPTQIAQKVDEAVELIRGALDGTGTHLVLGHLADEHPFSLMFPTGPAAPPAEGD